MLESLRGYDEWKLRDPYVDAEDCICSGLNLSGRACPVHDPEWFDEDGRELEVPRNLDDEQEDL